MTAVPDPVAHFNLLGGLHDAFIDRVTVDLEERTLTLAINDLGSNVANPPVAHPRAAQLVFGAVSRLRLGLDTGEGVRIGKLAVDGQPGSYQLKIALSLGGIPDDTATWWMSADFASLDISETKK